MSQIVRKWPYTALFGVGAWLVACVLFLIAGIIKVGGGETKAVVALAAVSAVVGAMGWIAAVWSIDSDGHGVRSLPLSRELSELQWVSAVGAAVGFVLYRGVGLAAAVSTVLLLGSAAVWLLSRRRPRGYAPGDLVSIRQAEDYGLAVVKEVNGTSLRLLVDFAPRSARRPHSVQCSVAGQAGSGDVRVLELDELHSLSPRLIWRGLATH